MAKGDSLHGLERVAGVHRLAYQIVAGISVGAVKLPSAENRSLVLYIEENDDVRLWEEIFDFANIADRLIEQPSFLEYSLNEFAAVRYGEHVVLCARQVSLHLGCRLSAVAADAIRYAGGSRLRLHSRRFIEQTLHQIHLRRR